MSLLNFTVMNTNPACAGFGPTAPASDPYRTAQFVIFVLLSFAMVVSSCGIFYMRQHRRRLRLRSPVPVVLSSMGGMALILLRTSYDLVGREFFPCTLNLVAFYLLPPLIIMPDMVSSAVFLSKQYQRHLLNASTLQALEKKVRENTEQLEKSRASVLEYFQGLWDFSLSLVSLTFCCKLDQRHFYHSVRKPSVLRESSYELLAISVLCIPFVIALVIRVSEVPQYNSLNACTGCLIQWQDILINTGVVAIIITPVFIQLYTAVALDLPDPLFSITDMKRGLVFAVPLFICGLILIPIDPSGLMQAQLVDWHLFEMAAVFVLHVLRTSVQLYRTRRIHKMGEKNINLIEILADGRGSILFEKHLIGELANENLLFWREAIKYKLQFDRNNDFEYSQQMAKVLWRTFISPHASLPINVSDSIKKTIDARFKGTVGKGVFDEALAEVYLMMQNGAFQRFIHSTAFKEYASTKADFSMSTVFNPMSIVPSAMEEGNASPMNMDIKEYIRSL